MENKSSSSGDARSSESEKSTAKTASAELNRLRRRQAILSFFRKFTNPLSICLFIAGAVWLIALPHKLLSRHTYLSENALLSGQIRTQYSYNDHQDVRDLEPLVAKLKDASHKERSAFVMNRLKNVGLDSSVQLFNTSFGIRSTDMTPGSSSNAYGLIRAPKSDGTEAFVLSASWFCRKNGKLIFNSHGVLLALSLAKFWRRYGYWAKDVVIVIADEESVGTEAWLMSHHGITHSHRK